MSKVCTGCGKTKDVSEYYRNPSMKVGTLSKCKDCIKASVMAAEKLRMSDPVYREEFLRKKRIKNNSNSLIKRNPRVSSKKHKSKYPEKAAAGASAKRMPPAPVGFEKHHWSYNKEHHKDIILLSKKHHNKAHRFIVYDQERMMYRRCDNNELLDTKDRHSNFINHCIKNEKD